MQDGAISCSGTREHDSEVPTHPSSQSDASHFVGIHCGMVGIVCVPEIASNSNVDVGSVNTRLVSRYTTRVSSCLVKAS